MCVCSLDDDDDDLKKERMATTGNDDNNNNNNNNASSGRRGEGGGTRMTMAFSTKKQSKTSTVTITGACVSFSNSFPFP